MGHSAVDVVQRGHKAYTDRDFDTLSEMLADDIVWHSPGSGLFGGTFRGRDEVMNKFFLPQKDLPVRIETRDVLTSDEHVASVGEFVVRADGEERRFMFAEVMTFQDGKLTERWGFVENPAELESTVTTARGA